MEAANRLRLREDVRRYIETLSKADPTQATSVRKLIVAKRAILSTLLAVAGLQYYFLTVFIDILSMPSLVYFKPAVKLGMALLIQPLLA